MSSPVREPLELCRPCGQKTHASWGFCYDDIHCPMCGKQILHIQIAEELSTEGEWVPICISSTAPTSRIHLRAFRSVGNHPMGAADIVSVREIVDWEKSSLIFEDRNIGQIQMRLSVPEGAKRDSEGWLPVNVVLVKVTNRKFSIPQIGISGQLVIRGIVTRVRNARLLRRPAQAPWFQVNNSVVNSEPIEIRGYQNEEGVARLAIPLTDSDRRIVIQQIKGFETLNPEEYQKFTIYTPLPLLVEFNRTTEVNVEIRAKLNPQPEVITLQWFAVGSETVMETPIKLNLRRLPPLEFEPRPPVFRETYLGQRPVSIDVLLKTGYSPSQENLKLGECTISTEPSEGRWLEFESDINGLEIPSSMGFDSRPEVVRLNLNTSRLERIGDHTRELIASVIFRDEAKREYPYEIRVKARRMPVLMEPVAIDWGTTNTCLARGDGKTRPPVGIKMSDRTDDLERFTSDLYFEDLSDPEKPIFHIGDEAIRLARTHQREECWLRSLKRKFLEGGEVFVRDIHDREWSYPVEVLTKMTILKLIGLAERQLGYEIQTFGVTFPTKWTAQARRRFTEVINEVRVELSKSRSPVQISVYEPKVDEANAVALQILSMGYTKQFNRPFTVLAYDFGGGTIDTSIVLIEKDNDTFELKSTYLGIGGLGNFGGDEVTRAIVLLLKKKLDKALENFGEYEILIHQDGVPPSERLRSNGQLFLDARRNWSILWGFAERIKYRFSDANLSADNPVRKVIENNLIDVICHNSNEADKTNLFDILQTVNDDRSWENFFSSINFDLKEVCEFPFDEGKTVLSQVEDTFRELKQQLRDANLEEPDLLVLAGGGCRLPLIREIAQKYFPNVSQGDKTIYDPKFAKQRVAHGKVFYLNLCELSNAAETLGLSVSVLHRPLAIINPAALFGEGEKAKTIVPLGASVENPEILHEFEFTGNQLRKNELIIYVRYWKQGEYHETNLGRFILTDIEIRPKIRYHGFISLSRKNNDIELQLSVKPEDQSERIGPYTFTKIVQGSLEEWLQGVWSNTLDEGK